MVGPARRAESTQVLSEAGRGLWEHRVGAQVSSDEGTRPRTFKASGEVRGRGTMGRALPVLGRSAKTSAKGLGKEDVVEGVADRDVGVDEIKEIRMARRAKVRPLEKLELDDNGADAESRIVKGGGSILGRNSKRSLAGLL